MCGRECTTIKGCGCEVMWGCVAIREGMLVAVWACNGVGVQVFEIANGNY